MLSSRFTKNTLEKLPDELLLSICRYLSSADVLFSFYGLNSRLSQTISGYYQHVVIAKLPYTQFHCICTSILPHVGLNISSLVISNQWKGVLSTLFLNYFSDKMSLIFPQLKHLTFISFNSNSLKLFLNSLQNLPQLRGINLYFQYDGSIDSDGSETLLDRLFSANNNRLNSILFDDESIIFSVDDKICNRFYCNIQKLSLDIKTLCDLHQLLTILPQLISITVTINEDSSIPDNINTCTPVHSLKELQLQSFSPSWSYDELASILKRIPNVEILSISIETYDDERLIDGKKFSLLLSNLSLHKFNYFLQYYNSSSSSLVDSKKIVSSWKEFNQKFICIKNDEKKLIALYTVPFIFSYLILHGTLARNEIFIDSYASQVKMLTLYEVSTDLVDIFSIIKKSRQIQRLNIRMDEKIVPQSLQQIHLGKLPYLTKVLAWRGSSVNMEYFRRLLEIAPNLYHLEVNFEFIRSLLDNEYICELFRRRITHLYISIPITIDVESVVSSISRLTTIATSLKHFYLSLLKDYKASELTILDILKYLPNCHCLISFGIVDIIITKELVSKDIHRWILENSTLYDYKPFFVDYTGNIFRLWF
ncbi:unnamed protein product [Adineta steineri]|uniref:F-box domain-containing protein n=1 Tax=Adineta steineri TaxID=433720 RepID=A0A813U5C9_9BILA|nr:unnamed protein product [Adineta steineri]